MRRKAKERQAWLLEAVAAKPHLVAISVGKVPRHDDEVRGVLEQVLHRRDAVLGLQSRRVAPT